MDNQNMTYPELRDLFVEHNKTQLAKPVSACIVFAESNWPDRHYRWRAVPADPVPFPALLPRSGVCNGSGADVRWPADAEQRGENRLC